MRLEEYPRPAGDTGWGFHDSAGTGARPANPAAYARYLRQELGIAWYKALVAGINKVDLAIAFTREGIEVIVRLYSQQPHPFHVVSVADVVAYVQAGVRYFEWGNEPNLVAEWDESQWYICCPTPASPFWEGEQPALIGKQWLRNVEAIRQGGGIPLLPALSPGGHYQHRRFYRALFEWLKTQGNLGTLDGAALAIHNRPLNNPLTHRDATGCFFLEYEWIDDLVRAYVGRSLPLLGTEAGYEPGWQQNPAFPPVDLQRHAAYNAELLRGFGPHGSRRWRDALFCQCHWLVDSFGHGDFSEAAWHNNRQWAGGGNLPAVDALRHEWATHPFIRQFGVSVPTPIGDEEVQELIRKAAWQALKVPWNPAAAFKARAEQDGLGMPLLPEQDITIAGVTYRFQVFALGIVYARLGDWRNCQVVR